jgi:glucosamine-6-phosphate deaminase
MKQFEVDQLDIRVYATRAEMGQAAALVAGYKIREILAGQGSLNMIFAAAPSQNDFLDALIEQGIDWQRINAFHMDEYIGLPENALQRFGYFLKEKLFSKVPFASVNYINGNAADRVGECDRYANLLIQNPPDIVCMGIGENGHIAFNDPHVADFNDPKTVKIVDLDHECRQQQVNDQCFDTLDKVPTHALTLTIPALMAAKHVYCIVPGKNKARAIYDTLQGEIHEQRPASILRKHPNAILYLDSDSAGMLNL